MNLHNIVSGAIGTINPFVEVTLKRSTGYATAADGKRTPDYSESGETVQVQALSAAELQQLDGLNIQGVLRKAYLNGDWRGVYRRDNQGGDLFVFALADSVPQSLQGTTWKVVQVMETWADWCALAIQLQMD
ncbi:hypothetical protein OKW30_001415 [Paraburkholderia sp. Clong3]|uniref:hypothetical protein n=1 Tax=Paraburkholderia sp. Clong3 TaxID=2991061 RepID=UPI003D1B4CEB